MNYFSLHYLTFKMKRRLEKQFLAYPLLNSQNEWMNDVYHTIYFRYTFIISIIFLSNILCWYSIPMKSSVSIRSLASWRKCRCSTLLCASFIFSLFYQFAIILLNDFCTQLFHYMWMFVHFRDEMQFIFWWFTTQSLHVVLLPRSLSVNPNLLRKISRKVLKMIPARGWNY